jgi:TATA-binding protein-associated factor Taf7
MLTVTDDLLQKDQAPGRAADHEKPEDQHKRRQDEQGGVPEPEEKEDLVEDDVEREDAYRLNRVHVAVHPEDLSKINQTLTKSTRYSMNVFLRLLEKRFSH